MVWMARDPEYECEYRQSLDGATQFIPSHFSRGGIADLPAEFNCMHKEHSHGAHARICNLEHTKEITPSVGISHF